MEDGENEEIDDVDPTQFLARDDDDDHVDDQLQLSFNNNNNNNGNENRRSGVTGGPSILTSLGLTHINHVNPYNFLVCFYIRILFPCLFLYICKT